GQHVDGHDYVGAAAAAGAAAAIVERPLPGEALPQLVVGRSARALATAAAWWDREPSHELAIVGITGTDGKTTTSFLAAAGLEAAGIATGLVGTVDVRVGPAHEPNPAHVTTPEAPELQGLLRAMVSAGDAAAVVETTSHGLALDRVAEVAYDAAILTNLTHEHLELHGSFEAYRAAKLSLFERLAAGQPFGVVIDYAHSPASLEKVLDLLAPIAAARGGGLIAVFGSAGERDTDKRPMMGRIAGDRCRLVVVTDEDPRGEDREAILDDIARGAEAAGRRRDHD